jgi:hypothetical protein
MHGPPLGARRSSRSVRGNRRDLATLMPLLTFSDYPVADGTVSVVQRRHFSATPKKPSGGAASGTCFGETGASMG